MGFAESDHANKEWVLDLHKIPFEASVGLMYIYKVGKKPKLTEKKIKVIYFNIILPFI